MTVTIKKRWAIVAVPLVIILAAALAFLLFNKGKEPPPQGNLKIIVLPFENLGSTEDENIAVGVSDGIRMRLSKLHGLDVIFKDTAVSYKNTGKTASQIRDETDADYILSGKVSWDKKEGEISRVRIRPSLTQALDNALKWSDEFERDIQDKFTAESEISEQVTRELDLFLQPEEIRAIEVQLTENNDAYQAYLSGIDHYGFYVTEEEMQLAIQMFKLAVDLDPEFALAYGYLSKGHSHMYHYGFDRTEDRISKARAAVDMMLDLEPELPETHSAFGTYYYWCLKDYDQALKEFSIAEKELPNDADILVMIGFIQRRKGDLREAIRVFKRSLELDPQDSFIAQEIGASYLSMRNFPEAEHYLDKAILVDPSNPYAYMYQGITYWFWSGDIEKINDVIDRMPQNSDPAIIYVRYLREMAREDYQAALEILSTVSFEVVPTAMGLYTKSGLVGEAYAAMEEMDLARASFDSARLLLEAELEKSPQDPRIRSSLGLVYASLGRKEEAIHEGEKAMEIYPVSMDHYGGPRFVYNFAEILVRVGEYEKALEQIDYLLSIHFMMPTVASLQNNPKWKSLHDYPRFKQILNKSSK